MLSDTDEAGLVIANLGATLLVEDKNSQQFQCHARRKLNLMVSGDRVQWVRLSEKTGVIESVLQRKTELVRVNKQGKAKALAANIDQLIIVCSVKPMFDTGLIDAYIAVAENMGIDSVIVLNKKDLFVDAMADAVQQLQSVYQALNYAVVTTSKQDATALLTYLSGKTSVLVGQSGVGKSTLINNLVPDVEARTGALSEMSDQGRHTTTTTMLYHLEQGGDLIDSPGVREFVPDRFSNESLQRGFREFREIAESCRFRDCKHLNEPDCAVLKAFEDKIISPSRMESYRRLALLT